MARPESQALGGFFAAPTEVLPAIASLVRVVWDADPQPLIVADPCAGMGEAVTVLTDTWILQFGEGLKFNAKKRRELFSSIFACEMERSRCEALSYGLRDHHVEHGDAFLLTFAQDEHVHILWHNPPYDTDREMGRLEERWLRRFAPLIAERGVLLHFVPFYSLAESAETIARHFDLVHCYRLPTPHFDVFKQVVLVGRKRLVLASPDPKIVAQVRAWSGDAGLIPELPIGGLKKPLLTISTSPKLKAPSWGMGQLDLMGLLENYRPWSYTDRGGRSVAQDRYEPDVPYPDLMSPRLRLGCAPRPAHIAIAAGAGVLSGAKLTPDPGMTGPELLLKGIHRRTFKHLRFREKEGEIVAEERQHHPELQLSALNLRTHKYRTLTSTMEPSGSTSFDEWTVGDLLLRYGQSMLAAMRERCDLIFDPERDHDARLSIQLSPDPLLGGQERAVRGLLRLLGEPDRSVLLLGETGVGKTRMALTAAYCEMKGQGKLFVICPTAVIAEWKREVELAFPGTPFYVLETVEDVDAFRAVPRGEFTVAVMSKEQAKLGHEWIGAPLCSKCGEKSGVSPEKLADRRATCETVTNQPGNSAARALKMLALHIGRAFPDPQLGAIVRLVGGRVLRAVQGREGKDWRDHKLALRPVLTIVRRLLARSEEYFTRETLTQVFWSLLHAFGDDALILKHARALFRATLSERTTYGSHSLGEIRAVAARTLLLLHPFSPWISTTLEWMRSFEGEDAWNHSKRLFDGSNVLQTNKLRRRGDVSKDYPNHKLVNGEVSYLEHLRGSDESLRFAIERLATMATWEEETCGEPLFQAAPKPRRVPLARYILARTPDLFDMFVADEFHVFAHGDSAQSRAAKRLLCLCMRRRLPVIAMTGSIMNGYARSLFVVLWHLFSAFRREFAYNDEGEFERRFGFLVQVVEKFDDKTKERVSFGKASDRVMTRSRTTGSAPGILPTAVLQYLLPISVTVQHSDLDNDLPTCRERTLYVTPNDEQKKVGQRAQDKLLERMGADRFKKGCTGKLFGALGHLPRYYDGATSDVGNGPDGAWTVAYPEHADIPVDHLVYRAEGLDPSTRLPKEVALLEIARAALDAGRNVMVATTRTKLAQRLSRILSQDLGEKVALLDVKKVSAKNRRDWVEGVKKDGYRIAVANPAALPMGLNNLVYFSTVPIFDDPNNDPTLLRQFRGRFVRIGQVNEVELISLVYEHTLQEDAHDLLSKKRIIAEAADGLDVAGAFEVAGVGDSFAFEFDLGKAIYARLHTNNVTRAVR